MRPPLRVEPLEDRTTPIAPVPDAYTTPAGTTLRVPAPGVLANDNFVVTPAFGFGSAFLSSSRAVLASGIPASAGSLSLADDGSFTYDPAPGFAGAVAFGYSIAGTVSSVSSAAGRTDPFSTDPELVTITVTPPAAPPVTPPLPGSPPPVVTPPGGPPAAPAGGPAAVGVGGQVVLVDPVTGVQTARPSPFGGLPTRTAVGDLTGDGVADFASVPGAGGGPVLNVVDGRTGNTITNLFALPGADFRGGLTVAVGAGAGGPLVAVGAGNGGGPLVRVLDARTMSVAAEFFAFDPALRTGASVALADVTGDGIDDLIVGTGPGVEGQVKVIDGTKLGQVDAGGVVLDPALVAPAFLPFPGFSGGLSLAGGRLDADGREDFGVVPGAGGGAVYAVYFGKDVAAGNVGNPVARPGLPDGSFRGGLTVATADANGDGIEDVLLAPGPGGGPVLLGFDAATGVQLLGAFVGDPAARGGATL